jgi:raffinose/stachyose/melibiose transport system substrate-binding protein
MKKLKELALSAILIVLAGSIIYAGGMTESSQSTKQQTRNLTMWSATTFGMDEAYNELIDLYTEQNPGVAIEFSSYPVENYETVLKTALVAKSGPDLFFTHGWNNLEVYVKSGDAALLEGKIDTSLYDDASLMPSKVGGKLYAAPGVTSNVLTVFYNRELFRQLNLSVPKTYEEFITVCETLTANGIAPIAMGGAEVHSFLFPLLTIGPALIPDYFRDVRSGEVSTLMDARFIDLNKKLLEWAEKGYYQKKFEGTKFGGAMILFQNEQAGMLFTGSWDYAGITEPVPELEVGAFPFPGKTEPVGVRTVNAGFSANANSANIDDAISFLNFASSRESAEIIIKHTKGIPVLSGVGGTSEAMKEAIDVAVWDDFFQIAFNIAGMNNTNIQDVWMNGILDVFAGNQTFEDLIGKMDAVWDREIYQGIYQ